jgi:hypothetical protein
MNLYLDIMLSKLMKMSQPVEKNTSSDLLICVICNEKIVSSTLDHKCMVRKENEQVKIKCSVGKRN